MLGLHAELCQQADVKHGSRDDAGWELRSAQAVGYPPARGFPQAINLEGCIDAWSATIDPDVPRH